MGETVQISVDSDLGKIVADLQALQQKARGTGDQIKRIGDELDKNLQKNTKLTERHFERLRDLGRRLADQLRGYFASLTKDAAYALEGVKKDLGLRQQFIDATKGAVELHAALQRIGSVMGVNSDKLVEFQQQLTRALGQFSQADIAGALGGISETQVRGQDNVTQYAKTALELGTITGHTDQAGDIAKAIADVLRAQGRDQNNMLGMRLVADDVRKTRNATGEDPLKILQRFAAVFEHMAPESRAKMDSATLRNVSAVSAVIGPQVGELFAELTARPLEKLPKDAQGLGKLVTPEGFDFEALDRAAGLTKRIGFDKTSSAMTTGLSEGSAQALIRLLEQRVAARQAQDRVAGMGGSVSEQARASRGLTENAGAIKNQVTGAIGEHLAPAVDAGNKILAKAAETRTGSAAVMGAGFAAAAGGAAGLGAIAKALGGKLGGVGATLAAGTRAAAVEQITGQKTIPVYVVNVEEFPGGGFAGSNALGGAGGTAGAAGANAFAKIAGGLIAAEVGMAIGTAINAAFDVHTQGKTEEGYEGSAIERGMFRSFDAMLPLLKMFEKFDSVKDITRQIELYRGERTRSKLDATSPSGNRGKPNGASR